MASGAGLGRVYRWPQAPQRTIAKGPPPPPRHSPAARRSRGRSASQSGHSAYLGVGAPASGAPAACPAAFPGRLPSMPASPASAAGDTPPSAAHIVLRGDTLTDLSSNHLILNREKLLTDDAIQRNLTSDTPNIGGRKMPTVQKSLRIPAEVVKTIEGLAEASRQDFSATAIELLTEAVKMRRCPGIVFADSPSGQRRI